MVTLNEANTDLLHVHDIGPGECNITENRTLGPNGLYCWHGIVSNEGGKCTTGVACSMLNFIDARNRFCSQYGGKKTNRYDTGNPTCILDRYVPNLPGMDPTVMNQRGGITTYDEQSSCQGLNGWLHCFGSGIKQSMNEPQFMTHAMIALVGLFGIAIALRYTGIGSKAKKKLPTVFNTKFLKTK